MEQGTTIVLTTHDMEEADALCDRIAIIHDGRIVALGTAAELKARVAVNGEQPTIETPSGPRPVDRPGEKDDKVLERTVEGPTAQPEQDYQLQRALDLVRGVSMFTQRVKG